MKSSRLDTPAAGAKDGTLYVAFELSKSKWLIGIVLSGESKMSRHQVAGGDTAAVWQLISKKRAQAEKKLGRPVRVVSCYEAGFDGFWLDRWLAEQGIENRVLDPSSIELPRRARQAKTDRLDLERLMRVLIRHEGGEPRVCSVVPRRRPSRRMPGGCRASGTGWSASAPPMATGSRGCCTARECATWSRGARTSASSWRGHAPATAAPCRPGWWPRSCASDRLMLIAGQLAEVEGLMKAEREAAVPDSRARQVNQLIELKSIGAVGGETLANEVFWRDFQNRRQVGAYFGLAGTPYDSGESSREQGISKSGNGRARTLAIELAWGWLRYQPDSALSRWFKERVGDQKGLVKRIAIVALARKLMVALWRYLTQGVVPENAIVRAAAPAGR